MKQDSAPGNLTRKRAVDGDTPGVFLCSPLHKLSHHYERDTSDPRVVQELTIEVDDYGNVTRSAQVAFPRRDITTPTEQATGVVVFTENQVINDVTPTNERWHVGLAWRTTTWHVHDDNEAFADLLVARDVAGLVDASGTTELDWDDAEPGSGSWKRRVSDRIVTFESDSGTETTAGSMGSRALVYQTYQLALTSTQATALLALAGAPSDLTAAGYVELDTTPFSGLSDVDGTWARSGTLTRDADHFHVVTEVNDPFGNDPTTVSWHASYLFPSSVTDPLGNSVSATYDLRALAPDEVADPNDDLTQLAFDALGRVTEMALVGNASEGDTRSSPTAEFSYDTSTVPVSAWGRVRETHDVAEGSTRRIETTSYSDGAGNVVMNKVTAPPDGSTPRWIGNGRVVLNNKGPPTITDDPLGRAVRVDLPNGTLRRVDFDPWLQACWRRSPTTHPPEVK